MRVQQTNRQVDADKEIFTIDFHRFLELEDHATPMEIAEELGISIGDVQLLKKKKRKRT